MKIFIVRFFSNKIFLVFKLSYVDSIDDWGIIIFMEFII